MCGIVFPRTVELYPAPLYIINAEMYSLLQNLRATDIHTNCLKNVRQSSLRLGIVSFLSR
jgi:hypothetical protein